MRVHPPQAEELPAPDARQGRGLVFLGTVVPGRLPTCTQTALTGVSEQEGHMLARAGAGLWRTWESHGGCDQEHCRHVWNCQRKGFL